MEKMTLVQLGESQVDRDILEDTVGRFVDNEHVPLIRYDYAGPYCFVEDLPYETDHEALRQAIEAHAMFVWLITEPNTDHHEELIYWRGGKPGELSRALAIYDRALERRNRNQKPI